MVTWLGHRVWAIVSAFQEYDAPEGGEEVVTGDDQPIKVYEGELGDVVFVRSLMAEARIEVVTTGVFFGASREIYVRRGDEAEAREIVADFDSRRSRTKGEVLRGPWSTE